MTHTQNHSFQSSDQNPHPNCQLLFAASSSLAKCFNSFLADCFRSPQNILLKLLFSLFGTSNESRPVFSCYVKALATVVHYEWNWHSRIGAFFVFHCVTILIACSGWERIFFYCWFCCFFDGITWKTISHKLCCCSECLKINCEYKWKEICVIQIKKNLMQWKDAISERGRGRWREKNKRKKTHNQNSMK